MLRSWPICLLEAERSRYGGRCAVKRSMRDQSPRARSMNDVSYFTFFESRIWDVWVLGLCLAAL